MVDFKDMVNQILVTDRFIDERMEPYFEDTFQWTCREQLYLFKEVSTAVTAMETVGVWLAWYSNGNIRQYIQFLHDQYKHLSIQEAKNGLIDEIWRYFGSLDMIPYTEYLNIVYGKPERNIKNLPTDKLERIGNWLVNYFGINLQYQFNSTGGMLLLPRLDEECGLWK